jgi:hypothetical protein
LIALAALLADQPAVAPLFVVFGAACVILGCFYSRISGDVEATKEGVRMVVSEIERRGVPPEDIPQVLEEALDEYTPSSSRPRAMRSAAQRAAVAAVSAAQSRHAHLTNAFAKWLEERGWEDVIHAPGPGADIIARRGDETLIAEVKPSGSQPAVMSGLTQLQSYVEAAAERRPHVRGALVIPRITLDALSEAHHLARVAELKHVLEVYAVDADGDVERVATFTPLDDAAPQQAPDGESAK